MAVVDTETERRIKCGIIEVQGQQGDAWLQIAKASDRVTVTMTVKATSTATTFELLDLTRVVSIGGQVCILSTVSFGCMGMHEQPAGQCGLSPACLGGGRSFGDHSQPRSAHQLFVSLAIGRGWKVKAWPAIVRPAIAAQAQT